MKNQINNIEKEKNKLANNWYREAQVSVEVVPSYERAIVVLAKEIASYDPDQFPDDPKGYYNAVDDKIETLRENLDKIHEKGQGKIFSQGCDRQIIIEAYRLLGHAVAPDSHTVYSKLVVLNETVRNCS